MLISHTRLSAILAIAAFAAVPFSPQRALAQDRNGEEDRRAETMIVVESSGLASMLVDEKDKSLREALGLLPAKVEELRATTPEFGRVPREFSDTMFLALSRPWRMAVTNKGFDQQTGRPGVGAVMSWHMPEDAGREKAMKMHRAIGQALSMSGAPLQVRDSETHEMMSAFTVPFMFPIPVHYGPREAADGWRYEMYMGDAPDPESAFDSLPRVKGMQTKIRGTVDIESFTPFVNMFAGFAAMAGPQAMSAIEDLRASGLIGEDAISVDFAMGYKGEQSVSQLSMRGLGLERGEMLGLTDKTIRETDYAAIPHDASFAQIQKMEPDVQWQNVRKQIGSMVGPESIERLLARFKQMTGYDLETQVIPSIGNTASFYLSDSTGGSSFLSSVMLVKLDDPETFHDFWVSVTGLANGMIAQQIAGEPVAVRFSNFEIDGTPFTQIQTPGLPLPFEPTFSVANGWLVMGATPQACHSAVRQAKFARRDITDNDMFDEAMEGLPEVTSVAFVDSSKTVRDGYPYLTMLGSAVANMVRPKSPDAPRQPGMVTPLYGDLVDDVQPLVTFTRWKGDDYITESRADASMMVNIAAVLGTGDIGDILSSAFAGGAIGAAIASEADEAVGEIREDWGEEWEDDWDEDEEHEHEDEHEQEKVH